jgi:hypothetical protein
MADELNLNDYTGEFRKRSGHLEDFSREFLVKLTHIYEDTILFGYHAWATAYAKKVGLHAAWDLAGEISRSMGRQVMPLGRYVGKAGADWKGAGDQVVPFDCGAEDLSKEGLLKLLKTYWDQWLKFGNEWVERIVTAHKMRGEEAAEIATDAYALIAEYENAKLAELCRIERRHVIDDVKLATIGIDATNGYQGEWEVVDPDQVVLRMYECEVMQKYVREGVFDAKKARWMCQNEARISQALLPGTKLDIQFPSDNLQVPPRQPFCIWTYTKRERKGGG